MRNPESLRPLPFSPIQSSPILRIVPPKSLHPGQPQSRLHPCRWLDLGFLPALDPSHLAPQTHPPHTAARTISPNDKLARFFIYSENLVNICCVSGTERKSQDPRHQTRGTKEIRWKRVGRIGLSSSPGLRGKSKFQELLNSPLLLPLTEPTRLSTSSSSG